MTHLPISNRVNVGSFAEFYTIALLKPIKLPSDKRIVEGVYRSCYERSERKNGQNLHNKKLRKNLTDEERSKREKIIE